MIIQRAGGYCFKISSGDTTIALNPPSSKSKHKVSKFGSDVVVISVPHTDWNGAEQATHNGKEPFVVSGPGAYEVGDIIITGYGTPGAYGDVMSDVGNTVYIIEMDGIRVLALGALSAPKLPPEVRSELDNIGIVLVPVGEDTLDGKVAHDLVNTIETKVIIPYAIGKDDALKVFLKAEGVADTKPIDKLTVRAKELASMDGAVVLLS
ncbi:MAG: MBL fold metallo-hydrolase [Candidatus Paceibacterota bacterium]